MPKHRRPTNACLEAFILAEFAKPGRPLLRTLFSVNSRFQWGNPAVFSLSTEAVVTNLLQVVSTVTGVYLAARLAHKNAADAEKIRSERDGYYMCRALLDELQDNIAAVEAWSREYQAHLNRDPAIQAHLEELTASADPEILKSGDAWVAWWKAGSAFRHTYAENNPAPLELSTFIWDTMKQQSVTFQLPADFISAVRRYYRQMGVSMQDVSTRSRLDRTRAAAVAIWQETRRMRDEAVPHFALKQDQLRTRLSAKGIRFDD
jgi:hypothetical protein